MTTALRLLFLGFVLLILLGLGAWWYLFGPAAVMAAQLVPSDTMVFLTIPNAAKLTTGYETSQLKKLLDAPEAQPLIDTVVGWIGQKNSDLIRAFLPNLSGQSFIAVTHFDPNKPAEVGLIAGVKPKPGLNNFDTFVENLKTAYPDVLKQGTTGAGSVDGVDYQWIQGPGAPDKICVAKLNGWIVTAWGEASLSDWIERFQKKSTTPSLADNPDYQKSLQRVGADATTLVYVDGHAILNFLRNEKSNPAASEYLAKKSDYLEKKLNGMGGMAIGSRFEQDEIVDRFSFLMPHQAQVDAGMMTDPCAFDTLKFTGPDTRFYWAFNANWAQIWKNWQEQEAMSPQLAGMISSLQTWAQGAGIDIQRNILDALGPEASLQVEWSPDTTYPEAGFFVKVNKPDDFKPTINAIIDTARKAYSNDAVINELEVDDHHYATLKFVQSVPVSPTITEDGDYFGLFLSENQAASSFKRDLSVGLLHNSDFIRQIGDKRNGATQIVFLDAPQLLNRSYQTVMPYLSLASMFNKNLAAALKGRSLPNDLTWIAPMGTWSFVLSHDDDGTHGYSVSGVGNQGIYLGAGLGAAGATLQSMGLIHLGSTPAPPPPSSAPPSPAADQTNSGSATPPATPVPASADTNSPSNSPPSPPPPDATTNSPPAPSPAPAAALSNTDAAPPTPSQAPTTQ